MARKKSDNPFGKLPRDFTVEERRELFEKRKKAMAAKADFKILQEDAADELIPFNRVALDYGLQLFGMARGGAVYQLHGDEGSGKSTVAAAIAAEYMRATGEQCVYFDYERRLKRWYLDAMGFDKSRSQVIRPNTIEEGVKQAIQFMQDGVRLFVYDSIPRMRSMVDAEAILDGSAFTVQPGTHARGIQQFYDIMLPHLAVNDCTLIMINQTRSRIEMSREAQMAAKGYHTVTNLNYTLPGGRANRYAVSVMIENKLVRAWKPGQADELVLEKEARRGEEYLALEIRHRTLKNTISGTGYRQATSWIRPGLGLDENISVRHMAKELGLVHNYGKRWFLGEEGGIKESPKVYDSKQAAVEDLVLDENPDSLALLKGMVVRKIQEGKGQFSIALDDDSQRYLAGEGEDPDPTEFQSTIELDADALE